MFAINWTHAIYSYHSELQLDSFLWLQPFYFKMAVGISAIAIGGLSAWKVYQDSKLPPGPRGWPIVGSAHLVRDANFDMDLVKLAKVYGDIFSLRLGRNLFIVLSSHSAVKDAFVRQGDTFACRPEDNRAVVDYMQLNDDIMATPYQTQGWNQNKTRILNCLRGAGFGSTNSTEDKILEQITYLNDYLEILSKDGRPINFRDILPQVTVNVIFQILFNKKFEFNDPAMQETMTLIRDTLQAFDDAFVLNRKPRIIAKVFYSGLIASVRSRTDRLRQFVRREVKAHLDNVNPDQPRDFVDEYLSRKGQDNIHKLVDNTMVFLPDAGDTIALCLEWIILYLSLYQDVQKKIADEIESVTGGNRRVTWADRRQLVYTEATIREVIRIATPATVTGGHAVAQDASLRGYKIPRNATIIGLIYAVHRDPQIYDDPEEFRPERHIHRDGQLLVPEGWIPFSVGRRKCPGEHIAQIELFLFTANLTQKFQIGFPEGQTPSLKPNDFSFVRSPQTFSVILCDRAKCS